MGRTKDCEATTRNSSISLRCATARRAGRRCGEGGQTYLPGSSRPGAGVTVPRIVAVRVSCTFTEMSRQPYFLELIRVCIDGRRSPCVSQHDCTKPGCADRGTVSRICD